MDSKKVIEKLVKIAENQQKIIAKLVQAQQGLPPDALPSSKIDFDSGGKAHQLGGDPPVTRLDPAKTVKDPAAVFYGAMTPAQKGLLASAPVASGSEMQIRFKANAATQANYDGLLKLLQTLTNQNKIQSAMSLKVV